MALLFITTPSRSVEGWIKEVKKLNPSLDVRVFPQIGNPDDIRFVVSWYHQPGSLKQFKNLKCISSLGAGVEFILEDKNLPQVPIARVVDPSLVQSMKEYLIWAVLHHVRRMDEYSECEKKRSWPVAPLKVSRAGEICIGIMGLGQLGREVGKAFVQLGFKVCGWSQSKKNIQGIESFGKNDLVRFLEHSHVLICLLPLTQETENILNKKTFSKLPKGAYVINVARGKHIVEKDLIQAVSKGHLGGACLDVFRKEPLEKDHPFWKHPKIKVTPHISSITDPLSAAPQLLQNYKRALSDQPLLNLVDRKRGY
ncbi:MAG: glyoxylate/hydroxypyruvate reductase A [Deltaproteobacteria bacterium]|nr:glyoxylate/hydroxypyruvate reductase A [Deltaproteobacteria bacterium]